MNYKHISLGLFLGSYLYLFPELKAQETIITLQQLTDSALVNNRALNIKSLQIDEKKAKIKEDNIKKYPVVQINSTYQYNPNIGELLIPQGSFGALPISETMTIPLPGKNESFALGKHNAFNAGVSVYQPLTQQSKIKTGIDIARTEVLLSEKDKQKTVIQISQAVERLYYGILINQKQQEETKAKLELAQIRLYDVENALLSGKTIEVSKTGLQASIADEEQNQLKLEIQQDDYWEDLKRLTGLQNESIVLAEVTDLSEKVNPMNTYQEYATGNNIDIQIASLTHIKAQQGLKAAQQSYLPDLGIIAGYTYQLGNIIIPRNNPYVGLNFKWNLQDIFSNKHVLEQRKQLVKQAEENIAYNQEQISSEISKTYRKINQSEKLIAVAQKAVNFRMEEIKIQSDKRSAGLNVKADILQAEVNLAKAKADLYAAELAHRLAVSDLKVLTGI